MPKGAKYGGRTKGTANKRTAATLSRAENVLQIIERRFFEKDIEALTSAQRMILYSDMLEYVSPKLSRAEVHGEIKTVINVIDTDE